MSDYEDFRPPSEFAILDVTWYNGTGNGNVTVYGLHSATK